MTGRSPERPSFLWSPFARVNDCSYVAKYSDAGHHGRGEALEERLGTRERLGSREGLRGERLEQAGEQYQDIYQRQDLKVADGVDGENCKD